MKRYFQIAGPLLLAAMTLGVSHPASAQKKVATSAATTTQKNRAAGKPLVLNGIRETTLPNGLTVLTKEVHAAPVVYFSVWYKVGSVNEEVGQTGMSHLMEHMMFKGTKTRGPGVISFTLQNNGAEFNANTWFDRTSYFETLASDRLELAMQIESDRMVNSLYDEKQHQKEMTVVRSEYEGGENNPGTALSKAVRLAAYQVHPYRWETIGFRSDIENFTRDEMYAYYKNYYTPNNATVVMVGDFDTANALAMVRRYFGSIPAHPIQQHFITPEPRQEGERRVVVRRAGTTPQMEIAYHIPGFGHPDRYVLDVLETVLSGGRTARFFQDLIQTGLASSAEAYDYSLRDPDLVQLEASAQPGHTNAELEKALLAEVDKLQTTPISAEELERALNQAEASYIYSKDSVEQQGAQLGENAMRGDWRYSETYVQHLRRVTIADVQRVARKYLIASNRTVGYFEPIVQPGGGGAPPPAGGDAGPSALKAAQATAAEISYPNRGVAPQMPTVKLISSALMTPRLATRLAANPAGTRAEGAPKTKPSTKTPVRPQASRVAPAKTSTAKMPKPTRVVLDNGLTIIVQENHANPTVSLGGAMLSAGGVFDPQEKLGLASFTASQLSRGTENRSLLDIARTLEGVGASVSVGAGEEYVSLGGHSLTKDFNTILDVLSDELRHPAFPVAELQKAKRQALAGVEEARQSTGTLARIAFNDALFPPTHPYYSPTLDQQAAVIQGLTREDLMGFHDAHYAPDKMVLTIVGDVKTADAIAAVKRYFGDWQKKGNLPAILIPDTPLPSGPTRTIVIPVPDKAQVDVRYGYPGQLKRRDPDFYRVVVMNTILGGGTGLSSRLATNVRDRLGLVYGIYAQDEASLGAGPFAVQFGSNPANVDKAIAEMNRQLNLMRQRGVTPQEVSQAVAYLTGSYPVTLSTNGAVAGQLLIAEVYGLGLNYIQKRNSYYKAVTVPQVNAAIQKYLRPGVGTLVIAGTYNGKYAHAGG
ncbi:MAG: insulinase family protein [Abitibacteriaceae bacterium]|nr:insulinase family protein [Abditibacteriaceae bacterium]